MKDTRFEGYGYVTDNLPEGVVFFGSNGSGLFHQMTRNATPSDPDTPLNIAVDETIQQAEEITEDGTSVGFSTPKYHVVHDIPYARVQSTLSSSGGMSFADNIFFFGDDNVLYQIQCGSLLTPPGTALSTRKQLQETLSQMIDIVTSV